MFFEKYQFFVAIAECGSITKASDRLLISQPALSKYLSRLEAALDTQLFQRKSHPLRLTRSGEVFLRYVMQGIELEKQCMAQVENLKDNLVETLRIGIGRWRASCFLPQILPAFQEKYPFVKIEVVEGVSDVLADATLKGRVDISLLGAYGHYPYLESIPLRDEKVLLVGNSAHPTVKQLRSGSLERSGFLRADIRLFRQERMVMTTSGQGFSKLIETHFAKINFSPIEILRIESLNTGIYLAAQGNYFAFVPEIATRSLALPENITFFTFGEPELTFPVALVHRKSNPYSNSAKLFVDTVLAYYGQLPA